MSSDNTRWRKSSYSGAQGGNCVEVGDDAGRVLVRDTQDRRGLVLRFTPGAWRRFADRVKRSLTGPQPSWEGHSRAGGSPFGVSGARFPPSRAVRRRGCAGVRAAVAAAGGGDGLMARLLPELPLPLLPHDAAEIAPGVGVVSGRDGSSVVWVHGLATFAWDAGDEAARRLAAVQLVQLNAATQVQVAQAFGVIPVSVWRWAKALAGGGVAGLVPAARGPQRASKLTPQVIAQIRELDRPGARRAAVAPPAGGSESSGRKVPRP